MLTLIYPMKDAILEDRKSGPERRANVSRGPDHSDVGASKVAPPKKPRTTPAHKVCVRCKTDKAAGEFYSIRHNADGLRSWCKSCSLEAKQLRPDYGQPPLPREVLPPDCKRCSRCKEVRAEDDFGADPRGANGKSPRCLRCAVAYQKEQNRKNSGRQTEAYRKYMYGMTPEQFAAMRTAQNDCCAICARPFPNPTSTHVDHDHATDKVRGLLCNRCNHGLGMFVDDTELLERAAEYLRRHNTGSA